MTNMTNGRLPPDPISEERARELFIRLVRSYPLVTEEWRTKRRPLLEALIQYEYLPKVAAAMRAKYEALLRECR